MILGNTEKGKNLLYYRCGRESGRSRPLWRNRVVEFWCFLHTMRRRENVFTLANDRRHIGTALHPCSPNYTTPGLFFTLYTQSRAVFI